MALVFGGILFIFGGLYLAHDNLLIISNPINTQGVITKVSREKAIGPGPYVENLRITFKDLAGKEHKFEEKIKPAFRSEGQKIDVNYYRPDPSLATVSGNHENAMFGVVIIIMGIALLVLALVPLLKSVKLFKKRK